MRRCVKNSHREKVSAHVHNWKRWNEGINVVDLHKHLSSWFSRKLMNHERWSQSDLRHSSINASTLYLAMKYEILAKNSFTSSFPMATWVFDKRFCSLCSDKSRELPNKRLYAIYWNFWAADKVENWNNNKNCGWSDTRYRLELEKYIDKFLFWIIKGKNLINETEIIQTWRLSVLAGI